MQTEHQEIISNALCFVVNSLGLWEESDRQELNDVWTLWEEECSIIGQIRAKLEMLDLFLGEGAYSYGLKKVADNVFEYGFYDTSVLRVDPDTGAVALEYIKGDGKIDTFDSIDAWAKKLVDDMRDFYMSWPGGDPK